MKDREELIEEERLNNDSVIDLEALKKSNIKWTDRGVVVTGESGSGQPIRYYKRQS